MSSSGNDPSTIPPAPAAAIVPIVVLTTYWAWAFICSDLRGPAPVNLHARRNTGLRPGGVFELLTIALPMILLARPLAHGLFELSDILGTLIDSVKDGPNNAKIALLTQDDQAIPCKRGGLSSGFALFASRNWCR